MALSGFSARETNWLTRGKECFWHIAAPSRSVDETEIRDTGDNVRAGCERHPRATRKHHSAEEKIKIVLDGLRGEYSIAELCWREGFAESLYQAFSPGIWWIGSSLTLSD